MNSIITKNKLRIGYDSKTHLNVLLGFNEQTQMEREYKKIDYLKSSDFDISILTDLSLYHVPKKQTLWYNIVNNTKFAAGTVPIYSALNESGIIEDKVLTDIICEQCSEGVSIITIHPTATIDMYNMSKQRLIPITSRGGGIAIKDLMIANKSQNVYMRILDNIIPVIKKTRTIISIGSSFRSATILDGNDEVYNKELDKQIELAQYLNQHDISTIIETPGHVSPRQLIEICIKLRNSNQVIMPLGPIPTDIAQDQDDLAASIGATLMGTQGCADILSIVTRNEHTGGIPNIDSLTDAIKKYSIAKHIIDLYKLDDMSLDYEISKKRSIRHSCISENCDYKCDRCSKACPLDIL